MGDGSASATSRTTAIVRSGVTEQQFTDFVKSTYRVLLTRGLRGCYVYFMDAPTRDFVLSRIERSTKDTSRAAETSGDIRRLNEQPSPREPLSQPPRLGPLPGDVMPSRCLNNSRT